MSQVLKVSEKYSKYWTSSALVSALCALILFIAYYMESNVLYEGYLRLGAFVCFAFSLLSYFKIRDGKVDFEFTRKSNQLLEITYSIKGEIVFSEEIDLNEVDEFVTTEMPNRSLYNDIARKDRCIKFRKKNSKDWIYFNMINGRVIPLHETNAESIIKFITSP